MQLHIFVLEALRVLVFSCVAQKPHSQNQVSLLTKLSLLKFCMSAGLNARAMGCSDTSVYIYMLSPMYSS